MDPRERFLEPSPYEADNGELIGRDPRSLSVADWQGVKRLQSLKAIRAMCIDCAVSAVEARKCVSFRCPLWPYRMGKTPSNLRAANE